MSAPIKCDKCGAKSFYAIATPCVMQCGGVMYYDKRSAHGVEVREPPTTKDPAITRCEHCEKLVAIAGPWCDCPAGNGTAAIASGEPNAPETGQAGGLTSTGDVRDTEPGNAGIEDALHQTRAASLSSSARQPSALKPCPFCGEKPLSRLSVEHGGIARIWCGTYDCALEYVDFTSVEAWNRRAVPDAQDARALLEEALEAVKVVGAITRLGGSIEGDPEVWEALEDRIEAFLQRTPGEP